MTRIFLDMSLDYNINAARRAIIERRRKAPHIFYVAPMATDGYKGSTFLKTPLFTGEHFLPLTMRKRRERLFRLHRNDNKPHRNGG